MSTTIPARDLRNNSADILRRANAGEDFVVTHHGIPVARVVPLVQQRGGMTVSRPARRRGGLVVPEPVGGPTAQAILDELREDRA